MRSNNAQTDRAEQSESKKDGIFWGVMCKKTQLALYFRSIVWEFGGNVEIQILYHD
jgi:hypothetical protein